MSRAGRERSINSPRTWRKIKNGIQTSANNSRGGRKMSGIRLLAGTKKGAFILTSDGKRERWEVNGPHFAGWEMYHLKGSPAEPDRIFASQTSGWFGQIIQRSDDGGKTWQPPGSNADELIGPGGMPKGESNKFVYEGEAGTPMLY